MPALPTTVAAVPLWEHLQQAAARENAILLAGLFGALALLVILSTPRARPHVLRSVGLALVSTGLVLLAVLLDWAGMASPTSPFLWAGLMLGGVAFVNLLALLVFDAALEQLRIQPPRIVRDLIVAACYLAVGFHLLARAGVSLSGIVTTSAVLTAIIGFSMQDTLGNIFGGLMVQMDRSIQVGDWIKVDQTTGRVSEIRWRHTAIETRNWETVIIPNSVLMKSPVVVLGRRAGQPVQWRRWVYFSVDFRFAPGEVVATVEKALQAEPIPGVAAEPPANCVCMDFKDSSTLYGARYWLTDLAADDPTDSLIRNRIHHALKRAGIPLSIPAASLFVTEETENRKELKHGHDLEQRLAALAGVELFHPLKEEERQLLAERMSRAPFARGEAMTRQGAEAHWLYILNRGSAEIQVGAEGTPRRAVARLRSGDFFGEMSLMTGAPRAATVIALEDSECYRLDKQAFQDIVHRRPELAEHISHVLARRETELVAAREGLDAEARALRARNNQPDLLRRIRSFFGLKTP
jgi:small-conductance mechanosensitive channel/CRP-like cAMP-binding protein